MGPRKIRERFRAVKKFRERLPRNFFVILHNYVDMMCSGPFRGAQGHNWLQTCTEGRDHIGWKRGDVVSNPSERTAEGLLQGRKHLLKRV